MHRKLLLGASEACAILAFAAAATLFAPEGFDVTDSSAFVCPHHAGLAFVDEY